MPLTNPQATYDRWVGDPTGNTYDYMQFLRHRAKGNILEIGVCDGISTACFLLGLEQNGGRLISIDIDPRCGDLFDHPQWTFVHGDSRTVPLVQMNGELPSFDILFIDGDHTHPGVDHDFQRFPSLIKTGGMILVHDIAPPPNVTPLMISQGWGTEDVRDAYHDYIRRTGSVHFELPGRFGMGVIYV